MTLDDEARLRFYEQFTEQRPGRAALFALQRACGRSVSDIAKSVGLSPSTIRNELRWAERQGHFEKAQDRLFRLLDKAVDVYEQALDDREGVRGDPIVAGKIIEGAGVLGKHVTVTGPGGDDGSRETFEVWRARFSRPAHPPSPPDLPEGANIIDIEPGAPTTGTPEGPVTSDSGPYVAANPPTHPLGGDPQ